MSACQAQSIALETEIWGTADETMTQYILVEYSGQWLPKMQIASLDLPESFAEALQVVAKRDGWKVLWIRKPGHAGRKVYWWSLEDRLCKVASQQGTWSSEWSENAWAFPEDRGQVAPQVLVCTHGQRDRCCGVLGGAIFAQLREVLPEQVWQVSHLGGHRFAPTALCLPSGLLLGRIEASDVLSIATSTLTGSTAPIRTEIIRGDVRLSKRHQAIHLWIRQQGGSLQAIFEDHFTWCASNGTVQKVQTSREPLGELIFSCGDTETQTVARWVFTAA